MTSEANMDKKPLVQERPGPFWKRYGYKTAPWWSQYTDADCSGYVMTAAKRESFAAYNAAGRGVIEALSFVDRRCLTINACLRVRSNTGQEWTVRPGYAVREGSRFTRTWCFYAHHTNNQLVMVYAVKLMLETDQQAFMDLPGR